MKKLILIIIIALSSLIFISCSHEKQLLRKASVAVDACNYARALDYYDQILLNDSSSFSGNAGKGVVLSEYMGHYDQAIPYLEKALAKSPAKNVMKIDNDLGKSYHFIGNYPRALYYYSKVAEKNKEESADYDGYLWKRIADCRYALDHPEVAAVDQQSVCNTGKVINTEMPDYDPVYMNGRLIFTSKRKDSPKERINGIDGRYFESMYVCNEKDGNFANARRYTLPDKGTDSRYKKGNESVLSASSNGKALYIFRGGQIYEADLSDTTKQPKLLPENINFADFQSGAYISHDGKMMVFSSDSPNGRGGTDIYYAKKNDEGNWSSPQSIFGLNTSYNEDSPFLSDDGNTLYFCSNGLPGYGGYDIYKSEKIDGEWNKPVNLGQPINTPGDETHFTLLPNSSTGYYASNRQGGYGDMDIYSVHYVTEEVPECDKFDSLLVLNAEPKGTSKTNYVFTASIPDQYKGHVKSINWKVNGMDINATGERVEYDFDGSDSYRIYAKVLVYNEKNSKLEAICNEKDVITGDGESPIVLNDTESMKEKTEVKGPKMTTGEILFGRLTDDQLNSIGWQITPALFDYNGTGLRDEAKEMLDHNVKVLKSNKYISVIINGYADSRGSDEYNMRLSERRANSVKHYMIQKGIPASRIRTKGYGESAIANGCNDDNSCDESQHQLNRKVDFYLSNEQKSITGLNR
jgi:outer membrane protein OmpA-like peptidoglycan-associated protein/tetratricopeptide (TPR) repeat protein